MTATRTAPTGDAASAAEPIIRARDVSVEFKLNRKSTVKAVSGVSIDVTPRSSIGLIGESGSGKSTLARALLGLVPVTSGVVEWEGQDISRLTADADAQIPHDGADGVPGSAQRSGPAPSHPHQHHGAPQGAGYRVEGRAAGACGAVLSLVGLRMDQAHAVPPSAERRSEAARMHRPRTDRRTEDPGVRRIRRRARRGTVQAEILTAQRPARQARPRACLHQPRPVRRRAHQ